MLGGECGAKLSGLGNPDQDRTKNDIILGSLNINFGIKYLIFKRLHTLHYKVSFLGENNMCNHFDLKNTIEKIIS